MTITIEVVDGHFNTVANAKIYGGKIVGTDFANNLDRFTIRFPSSKKANEFIKEFDPKIKLLS